MPKLCCAAKSSFVPNMVMGAISKATSFRAGVEDFWMHGQVCRLAFALLTTHATCQTRTHLDDQLMHALVHWSLLKAEREGMSCVDYDARVRCFRLLLDDRETASWLACLPVQIRITMRPMLEIVPVIAAIQVCAPS